MGNNKPLRKKRKLHQNNNNNNKLEMSELFKKYKESKNAQIEALKKKNHLLMENGKKLVEENRMLKAEGKKCCVVIKKLKKQMNEMRRVWGEETDVKMNDDADSKQRENSLEDGEIEVNNEEIDALLDGIDDDEMEANDENRPLKKRKKNNKDKGDDLKSESITIPFPQNSNNKSSFIDLTEDD